MSFINLGEGTLSISGSAGRDIKVSAKDIRVAIEKAFDVGPLPERPSVIVIQGELWRTLLWIRGGSKRANTLAKVGPRRRRGFRIYPVQPAIGGEEMEPEALG